MQVVVKLLMGLGVKLLTEKFLEDLLIILLEKLASSTKTAVDDKVVAAMKEQLGR